MRYNRCHISSSFPRPAQYTRRLAEESEMLYAHIRRRTRSNEVSERMTTKIGGGLCVCVCVCVCDLAPLINFTAWIVCVCVCACVCVCVCACACVCNFLINLLGHQNIAFLLLFRHEPSRCYGAWDIVTQRGQCPKTNRGNVLLSVILDSICSALESISWACEKRINPITFKNIDIWLLSVRSWWSQANIGYLCTGVEKTIG